MSQIEGSEKANFVFRVAKCSYPFLSDNSKRVVAQHVEVKVYYIATITEGEKLP